MENDWDEKIAVAHSLGEIIPVFLSYNETHPAVWREAGQGSYLISTHFGDARVEQDQSGSWVAYRNGDYRLLRDGEPARFATAEEAQRAVDIHLGDGLANFKEVKDGLSWDHDPLLELWSQPN